ncbi:MAG: transporter substrate-binding domain-containing protein [Cyanobacteria bacterium P01_D01_bin.123]
MKILSSPGAFIRESSFVCVAIAWLSGILAIPGLARPWADIAKDGRLRVAVKDNLPLLGFRNEAGELVGFEIDIARELAKELLGNSNAVELIPVTNIERLESVVLDEVDVAIAQLTLTADRSRLVDFSSPYYFDGAAIAMPRDQAPASALQLSTERVAVLTRSSAIGVLQAVLPDLELVEVTSYQEGAELVLAGDVAGMAGDISVLTGWALEEPGISVLSPKLSGAGLAIAMPRGVETSDLRRRIHQQMNVWKDSGWLDKRAAEWGLP